VRYYFDIHDNGTVQVGDVGVDLPDVEAAEQEATGTCRNGALRTAGVRKARVGRGT
jgi:hypothetical protein